MHICMSQKEQPRHGAWWQKGLLIVDFPKNKSSFLHKNTSMVPSVGLLQGAGWTAQTAKMSYRLCHF